MRWQGCQDTSQKGRDNLLTGETWQDILAHTGATLQNTQEATIQPLGKRLSQLHCKQADRPTGLPVLLLRRLNWLPPPSPFLLLPP